MHPDSFAFNFGATKLLKRNKEKKQKCRIVPQTSLAVMGSIGPKNGVYRAQKTRKSRKSGF